MLIPYDALIMAINGAHMSLFRNVGPVTAPMLKRLHEKRAKAGPSRTLGKDRPGRTYQSVGSGRAAYEASDLHEDVEAKFIDDMASIFNAHMTRDGQMAIVVAPPQTLGRLRSHLTMQIRQRVIGEIDKNYCDKTAPELIELLDEYDA